MLRHISLIFLIVAMTILPLGCTPKKSDPLDTLLPEKSQEQLFETQGDALYQQGKPKQAILLYERARQEDAPAARIAYKCGMAMMTLKNYPVALELFQEAADDKRYRANAYQASAFAAFGLKKMDDAEKYLRKALDENPNLVDSHNLLGVVLNTQNKPQEALEEFKTAVRLSSGSPDVFNNIGISYLKLNENEQAAKAFVQSLSLQDSPRTWNNLGLALCKLRRFNRALSAFEQGGSQAVAYNNMAICYKEAGLTSQADEYSRQAKELDPNVGQMIPSEMDAMATTGTPLDQTQKQTLDETTTANRNNPDHETFTLKKRITGDDQEEVDQEDARVATSETAPPENTSYATSGVLPMQNEATPEAELGIMPQTSAEQTNKNTQQAATPENTNETKPAQITAPMATIRPMPQVTPSSSPTPVPIQEKKLVESNVASSPQEQSPAASAPESEQTARAFSEKPDLENSTEQEAPASNLSNMSHSGTIAITDYATVDTPDIFVLRLKSTPPLGQSKAFPNTGVPGLVVDFYGSYGKPPKVKLEATQGLVQAVRMWAHPDKLRVVFDYGPAALKDAPKLSIRTLDSGTEIRLTRNVKK